MAPGKNSEVAKIVMELNAEVFLRTEISDKNHGLPGSQTI